MRLLWRADSLVEFELATRLGIANCVVDLLLYPVAAVLVGRIWQAQLAQRENPEVLRRDSRTQSGQPGDPGRPAHRRKSGGDHPDLALRKRTHDTSIPEGLVEDRLVDLTCRDAKVLDRNPGLDGNVHGRIRECAYDDHRLDLPQHTRVRAQRLVGQCDRAIQIRIVRNADYDIDLPNAAEVVQDLTDDLAIRNDDTRAIRMSQRRLKQRDGLHGALFVQRSRCTHRSGTAS